MFSNSLSPNIPLLSPRDFEGALPQSSGTPAEGTVWTPRALGAVLKRFGPTETIAVLQTTDKNAASIGTALHALLVGTDVEAKKRGLTLLNFELDSAVLKTIWTGVRYIIQNDASEELRAEALSIIHVFSEVETVDLIAQVLREKNPRLVHSAFLGVKESANLGVALFEPIIEYLQSPHSEVVQAADSLVKCWPQLSTTQQDRLAPYMVKRIECSVSSDGTQAGLNTLLRLGVGHPAFLFLVNKYSEWQNLSSYCVSRTAFPHVLADFRKQQLFDDGGVVYPECPQNIFNQKTGINGLLFNVLEEHPIVCLGPKNTVKIFPFAVPGNQKSQAFPLPLQYFDGQNLVTVPTQYDSAFFLRDLVDRHGEATGISVSLDGSTYSFYQQGESIDTGLALQELVVREDALIAARLSGTIESGRNSSKFSDSRLKLTECGMVCDSLDDLFETLVFYSMDPNSWPKRTDRQLGLLSNAKLTRALVTEAASHLTADTIEAQIRDTVRQLENGDTYARRFDYDAMGTPWFKCSVEIISVDGAYVLHICSSEVDDEPEERLRKSLKKPKGLGEIEISAQTYAVQEGGFIVDFKKIFSGTPIDPTAVAVCSQNRQAEGAVALINGEPALVNVRYSPPQGLPFQSRGRLIDATLLHEHSKPGCVTEIKIFIEPLASEFIVKPHIRRDFINTAKQIAKNLH